MSSVDVDVAASPTVIPVETSSSTPPGRLSRPALILAGFTLCWAITEALVPLSGVSAYEVVWTRYAVHLAFMVIAFGPRNKATLVRSPHVGRQIVRSLLMLGMPVCFIWAVQSMPIHTALDVFWIMPLLLLGIDRLSEREVHGWAIPLAAVIGFVGVLVILWPLPHLGKSIIFPLGTAFCLALYIVMTRSMRNEQLVPKLFHTALWVFLALTPFLPRFWRAPTHTGILAILGIGLIGWLALFLLDQAVDRAAPAVLAPVLYSNVLWSEVFQWIVSRTPPSPIEMLGSVLILIAVGLGLRGTSSRARGNE